METTTTTPSTTVKGLDESRGTAAATVRMRGVRGREPVFLAIPSVTTPGDVPQVSVRLVEDGEDVLAGARFLAALGSAPGWLGAVEHAQRVLNVCPTAPAQELLAFVTASKTRRRAQAEASGVLTPPWLGWAMGYDPDEQVALRWVEHMPVLGVIAPEVASVSAETAREFWEQFEAWLRDPRLSTAALARVAGDLDRMAQVIDLGAEHEVLWLIRNVNLPETLVDRLALRAVHDARLAFRLARDRGLSPNAAHTLAGSIDVRVLREVARNVGTPPDVWEALQSHPDPGVARVAWSRGWEEWKDRPRRDANPRYRDFYAKWRVWKASVLVS